MIQREKAQRYRPSVQRFEDATVALPTIEPELTKSLAEGVHYS
jgi:hypothetical protein